MLFSTPEPEAARVAFPDATTAAGVGAGVLHIRCSTCKVRGVCLPGGLPPADVERLDALRFTPRRIRARQVLFREGDRFQFVYAVRTGTFKSTVLRRDGLEQVTGFPFPGDLMGFEAVATGRHGTTATALEDAEICAIPYDQLRALAAASRPVQNAIASIMSREIVRERRLMMLLASMSSEERVAAFLLNVSQRMQARGYSPVEFYLRMTRAEIGSHLGVTLETVSRTLSAFQQQRLIRVRKKHVRIVDLEGLANAFEVRLQ